MSKVSKISKSAKKAGAYVRGLYAEALSFIRTKRVVTRSMVIDFYMKHGKKEAAAAASATVLLSPRKADSKRGKFGNCLGNYSADGVNYYMIKLGKVKGSEQKFQFHACTAEEKEARAKIEGKRVYVRPSVKEVKQEKTSKKTSKKVVKVKKTAEVVA